MDRRRGTIRTGAEPWNIVVSPNGRRVFVANSGQGTITVIDTKGRRKKVIGHVNLQRGRCTDPVDRKRQFQPRGLAVTKNGKRLLVTSFFAFTRPGGKQADDNGRQGVVCRLNVSTQLEAHPRLQGGVPRHARAADHAASRSTPAGTESRTRRRRSRTSCRAS